MVETTRVKHYKTRSREKGVTIKMKMEYKETRISNKNYAIKEKKMKKKI